MFYVICCSFLIRWFQLISFFLRGLSLLINKTSKVKYLKNKVILKEKDLKPFEFFSNKSLTLVHCYKSWGWHISIIVHFSKFEVFREPQLITYYKDTFLNSLTLWLRDSQPKTKLSINRDKSFYLPYQSPLFSHPLPQKGSRLLCTSTVFFYPT